MAAWCRFSYLSKCPAAIVKLYFYSSYTSARAYCTFRPNDISASYHYDATSCAGWTELLFVTHNCCLKLYQEACAAGEVNRERIGIVREITATVVTGFFEVQAAEELGFNTIRGTQVACHIQGSVAGSVKAGVESHRAIH